MKPDDLDGFLASLGLTVEEIVGPDNLKYTLVSSFSIAVGRLVGTVCDIAILKPPEDPYLLPSAIHTRPHLIAMNQSAPFATQNSVLGSDWQYWSRRYDGPVTPKKIWTHVLTVLKEAP